LIINKNKWQRLRTGPPRTQAGSSPARSMRAGLPCSPKTTTGALPLDPAGGHPSLDCLCPPYLQTLATLMHDAYSVCLSNLRVITILTAYMGHVA